MVGASTVLGLPRLLAVPRTVNSLPLPFEPLFIAKKTTERINLSVVLLERNTGLFLIFARHKCRFRCVCLAKPLAVPEEICASLP